MGKAWRIGPETRRDKPNKPHITTLRSTLQVAKEKVAGSPRGTCVVSYRFDTEKLRAYSEHSHITAIAYNGEVSQTLSRGAATWPAALRAVTLDKSLRRCCPTPVKKRKRRRKVRGQDTSIGTQAGPLTVSGSCEGPQSHQNGRSPEAMH